MAKAESPIKKIRRDIKRLRKETEAKVKIYDKMVGRVTALYAGGSIDEESAQWVRILNMFGQVCDAELSSIGAFDTMLRS